MIRRIAIVLILSLPLLARNSSLTGMITDSNGGAVREFRTTIAGFGADTGGSSGGQVSIINRSGSVKRGERV